MRNRIGLFGNRKGEGRIRSRQDRNRLSPVQANVSRQLPATNIGTPTNHEIQFRRSGELRLRRGVLFQNGTPISLVEDVAHVINSKEGIKRGEERSQLASDVVQVSPDILAYGINHRTLAYDEGNALARTDRGSRRRLLLNHLAF